VFHCFIGSKEQANAVFEQLDGMVSFTGIITFKKTADVQAVATWAPLERIMLETDSPYLSPEPHRGKLNIPGRTRFVAEKLAALRGISLDEVAAVTTANACGFFRLPALG
jgi:TatD DNase family protein